MRTPRLAEMTAFYGEVLGLEPGPRPPVRSAGAWLYCGGRAAVHLVEIAGNGAEAAASAIEGPRIDHFALRAEGLAGFLARLQSKGVAYRIAVQPGTEVRQVKLRDPDGNLIEVVFGPHEEAADLGDHPVAAG